MSENDRRAVAAALHPRMSYFAYLLRRLGRVEFGVMQSAVIGRLNQRSPQRVGDLARAEGVRLPTMTETVARLASQGWVAKERDALDRRGVQVRLTPKGRRLMATLTTRRTAYTDELLSRLSSDDLRKLEELVPILDRLFEERPPSPRKRAGR